LIQEEDLPEVPWADVIAVNEMSDVMREAWRRLHLGAPFRPEQYLSWEQSADEPFPTLRIHDLEVILSDDPYADLRGIEAIGAEEEGTEGDEGILNADQETQVPETLVFTDQSTLPPGDVLEGDPAEAAEEAELPDPTVYYRLDGTVLLRRSRFLHLDLDLELRQPVFDQPPVTASLILNDTVDSDGPEPPLPTPFLIHELKQSRQVKSQRMEYFDSPVLGVLAWITAFETEDVPEDEAENLSE
jgi:hypothetical protein